MNEIAYVNKNKWLNYCKGIKRHTFQGLPVKIILSDDTTVSPEEFWERQTNKVWKPKIGEVYFFVHGINTWIPYWQDSSYDEGRYSMGNCFKTKEECEFAIERLKVIAELKRFAEENNIAKFDWKNVNQLKYYLVYNHLENKISINYSFVIRINTIYFSSNDICKQAITKIGEDRLKKYYFEVSE